MPYQIGGFCRRVSLINDNVVEVFISDHGIVQQSAVFNLRYDSADPIERDAEYEVILRRKIRSNGERKETS